MCQRTDCAAAAVYAPKLIIPATGRGGKIDDTPLAAILGIPLCAKHVAQAKWRDLITLEKLSAYVRSIMSAGLVVSADIGRAKIVAIKLDDPEYLQFEALLHTRQ